MLAYFNRPRVAARTWMLQGFSRERNLHSQIPLLR
jgi:hypothetical protein